MNSEVENHGGSIETTTNEEPKNGWRKALEGIESWLSYKDKDKWLDDMRGNLSLVATVVATMTFQMVLNPPGGIRSMKDDANPPGGNANPPSAENLDMFCSSFKGILLCPGEAVLAAVHPEKYILFLISNTVCFIGSLSICLLLVCGIRVHHRFTMWFLSVGTCITLSSLTSTYLIALQMTTPGDVCYGAMHKVLLIANYTWMGLLTIIGLCLTLRLVIWVVKVYRKRKEVIKKAKTPKYLTLRLVTWGVKVYRKRKGVIKKVKTPKITKETLIC